MSTFRPEYAFLAVVFILMLTHFSLMLVQLPQIGGRTRILHRSIVLAVFIVLLGNASPVRRWFWSTAGTQFTFLSSLAAGAVALAGNGVHRARVLRRDP